MVLLWHILKSLLIITIRMATVVTSHACVQPQVMCQDTLNNNLGYRTSRMTWLC